MDKKSFLVGKPQYYKRDKPLEDAQVQSPYGNSMIISDCF